jgi:phosphoglycerate dehydrogenase-like enzyme
MTVVLWATYAAAEIEARLRAEAGDGVVVVDGPERLIAALPEADALVCPDFVYRGAVPAAVRENAPRLKFLQLLTQGFDHARQGGVPSGITVANAGNAYSPSVAVHAVAMVLALCRRFPATLQNQARHEWDRAPSAAAIDLDGRLVAIVGFGGIGREVARLLRPFGARIAAVTRSAKPDPLADEVVAVGRLGELLPRADAIVLALPLDESTRHLIGAPELAACKKNAVLVNIARGGIVDTDALAAALRAGEILGAGLDVTDPEPLPADHPLWDAPNLIITPHFAGACGPSGYQRLADTAGDNIRRFLDGEPLEHVVTL